MRIRGRGLRSARDRVDEEIAAWRDATNETAPWHLWSHAVEIAAIRKGAPSDVIRNSERVRSAMSRAFAHGEPVWMAADEVSFLAKEAARVRRHRTPGEELRAARALWYTHGPGKARDRARRRRDPHRWKVGDRFRLNSPGTPWHGRQGHVLEVRPKLNKDGSVRWVSYTVEVDGRTLSVQEGNLKPL